jgi:mRNA interferase HicA
MKFNELYKKLEKAGWFRARTKKHHIYKHDKIGGAIQVGKHGPEEVPTGTLHKILKQAGLK